MRTIRFRNRKIFPFKEELEAFKAQVISEIKNLIHKEISVLKEAITTHSNIDVLSGKAQTEEFYQEQIRFINEELRNKDNLINSLLHQLSKQTECITSLNNRFSNNAIDDNNNNNDNLNRKNNSHSNEYNNNNSNNNNNNNKNDNYNINSNHHNNISSNYFNDNNNNLSKNSKSTSVSANYDNISDNNSSHITPVIFLIMIVTTIIRLAVILIILIHLITAQIFLMISIISTVTIIVTRIREG